MKIKIYSYPFGSTAETRTSKQGKEYTSIGVWHKTKDKDGNKKEVYFNFVDERDLLVLSALCQDAYRKIVDAKNADHFSRMEEPKEEPEQTSSEFPEYTIPF